MRRTSTVRANMILSEFLDYCTSFHRQSEREHKNWQLVSSGNGVFLRLTKTLELQPIGRKAPIVVGNDFSDLTVGEDASSVYDCGNELASIEYHVTFNESYGAPVLLFNIYREYRGRMNMQDAWNVLEVGKETHASRQYETLTMVEHPVLFRPFLCLHPCKTMDLLAGLESENPITTFLSTYGRFIRLSTEDLPTYKVENKHDAFQ